ncbi:exo-alpha-sialidase [candidate division KSB1 bacterium]|nr:exo-alpha-sialidase [candidate division KSB1 bacterium]
MKIQPLAPEYITLYEAPDPAHFHCYSPGMARFSDGRLIASYDLGGTGMANAAGKKYKRGENGWDWQGQIITSDDHGQTWTHRGSFPFMHARPFIAGNSAYILGHARDLMIIRSDDKGETWTEPVKLTQGEFWHQAPCNVHYANGCVYLVMERRVSFKIRAWYVGELVPVLMRGRITDDLTRRANWTFASELPLRDCIPNVETDPKIDYFGVPFYACPFPEGTIPAPERGCSPMGWLETNVVQIVDPDHYWFDPNGRTFHLWMRAHTGGTGYAAIAKVVEKGDGTMTTLLETVPSGKKIMFVPCPGGQMKFHVLYDTITRLYWLLSSQAIDSMTRAEKLPKSRYNLPNNERHRLQLHFSKNMIDWCFAGIIALGKTPLHSRHYASMLIDGDDLHILSRSGDDRARSAHDGNLITFHTVKNFRHLIY